MSENAKPFAPGDRVMVANSTELYAHVRGKTAVVHEDKDDGYVLIALEENGILGALPSKFLTKLPSKPAHLVRRDKFMAGLIDLCRSHRVLLEVDDEDFDLKAIRFHGGKVDGWGFVVDMNEVESQVRSACWNLVNGVPE